MDTPLTFDDFAGFITELRRKGFPIGIDQYIAAREVLESSVARERLATNPSTLITLLAPILCNSAQQQEEFYLEFLRWLDRRAGRSSADEDRGGRRNPLSRSVGARKRRQWRVLLAIIGILGAGAFAVERDYISIDSDEDQFETVGRETHAPAMRSARERAQSAVASDSARKNASADSAAVASGRDDTVQVSITTTVEPGFYRRNYLRLKLGAAMLPLLALAVWVMSSSYRRRQLERQRTGTIPRFTTINFPSDPDDLFSDPEFRHGLQSLRRHRMAPSGDLDATATVEKTLRSGGWFSPVHAPRHVMPEYLVLVDRAGASDQQSCYFDRLVAELAEEGAYIDRYYFRGNPRSCVRDDYQASTLSLAELAALHPEHRLLIFSDGDGLFNPLDGTPHHWLDLFSAWDVHVLLTPESFDIATPRHRALLDDGFAVLPASADGISALGGMLVSEADDRVIGWSRPYPSMLLEEPGQWLGREFPGPGVAEDLRLQLLDYLGIEGYYWLAACSLFPMMQWELTLYLGRRLLTVAQVEELLPVLLRLPWMRHGLMPAWLRISMVGSLPAEQSSRMRGIIDELLEESSRRVNGIELGVGRQENPGTAPVLYDYVFLCFMRGRKPKQTSVAIPQSLRKLLYRDDQSRFALRPVLQFSLAAICLLVTVMLIMNPPVNPPVPTVAAYSSGGIPGSHQIVRVVARDAPDGYFDGARIVVGEGRRLVIGQLRASDSEIAIRVDVPDSETDRRKSIYRYGREMVMLGILQDDRIIGTFPFAVRH